VAFHTYLEAFLRVALLGFAAILFGLLVATYGRVRSPKLLLIALAFLLFALKGLVLTVGLFVPALYAAFPVPLEFLLVDFLILVLLYAGTVKG
jgi:hypothetical protein